MAISLKKALLTGTALVAVSFSATAAQALTADVSQIWAAQDESGNSLELATSGSDLDLNGYTVTVTNNGTANDGSGNTNNFAIGSVTGTDPASALLISNATNGKNLGVVFNGDDGIDIGGAFTVQGHDAFNAYVNVGVTNDLTAGSLSISTDESNLSKYVNVYVHGDIDITGAATVAGGNMTGADSYLWLYGAATFDNGLVLDDGVGGGRGIVRFEGDGGVDVSGTIDGAGSGEGTVVLNTGDHFLDALGSTKSLYEIQVSNAGTTTFDGSVDATKITFSNIGTLTFAADVNATSEGTINFNGHAATVTFDNIDATIMVGGDIIDSTGTGYGTVTVADGSGVTTSGSIGTAGHSINKITVGADSSLTVMGNIVTKSGLSFGDGAQLSFYNYDGQAQTVNSSVTGGEGSHLIVSNPIGVLFNGMTSADSIQIDTYHDNSTATFAQGLTASNIQLGGDGHAGDVNTIAFDGSTTVNGNIYGANALETNNITTAGGSHVTFTGDIGSNINSIQIGEDNINSYVAFEGNISSGTITLGGASDAYFNNTITFNSYNNAITVGAVLQGGSELNYNNIVITDEDDEHSGYSVTQTKAWTDNLYRMSIEGATFVSAANLTLQDGLTVYGDTGVFKTTSGTTTANILLYDAGSTLVLDGGKIVGNISGYDSGSGAHGVLNVMTNSKIYGNVGTLASLNIAAGGEGGPHTLTVTGTLHAADVTDIGDNTIEVGSSFTLGAGQELDVSLSSATTSGHVIVTGNATVDAGAKIVIGTNKAYTIANGTEFVIIDGNDSGTGVANIGSNLDISALDTSLVTFSQDTDNHGNFVLVAHTVSAADGLSGLSNPATAAGNALQTAALTSTDPAITDLMDAVDQALTDGDTKTAEKLLTSIAPTVDGGAASTAANSFGESVQHIAQTRMLNLMHGDEVASNAQAGVAAGSATHGASFWVQGFGQSAKQDTRDQIAGYDADSFGTSAGIDSANVIKDGVLGVSFTYGRTNANSKNSNTTGIDVDSYGVNLYASKSLKDGYFVNGQVGYAYNDIDSVRHNVGLGGTASANYSSDLYAAQLASGKDYAMAHGLTLTPSLSASYLHLATDGYIETGSGAPLLSVGSENADSLKLGAGLTAMWSLKDEDGAKLRPSLSVGYAYDTLADNIESTAHFTSGSPVFTSQGADPARNEFNGSAGLTYVTTSNWDLSANYDYTYKTDYQAHTGIVRGTVHF